MSLQSKKKKKYIHTYVIVMHEMTNYDNLLTVYAIITSM